MREVQVVGIGAGPSGVATALSLRDRGLRPLRATAPTTWDRRGKRVTTG